MPVLALHTLLLFSKSVHTDKTCTRVVCDNWLQLRIKNSVAGQRLLLIAHQLRLLWDQLLHEKLHQRKSRPVSCEASGSKQGGESAEQSDAFEDGSKWHEDRVGNPTNLRGHSGVDTGYDTEQAGTQCPVPPLAEIQIPLIPDSELVKLPKFAQHIYRLRRLPTKGAPDATDTSVQKPDELLAGKLSAFLAVPVSYTVERAKLSELAVELGLRKQRNPEQDIVGLKKGKNKHTGKADSMAMENLEAAQQLSRDSENTGGSAKTLSLRSQLGGRHGDQRKDSSNGLYKYSIEGHRLAPWLHYGSLRAHATTGDESGSATAADDIHSDDEMTHTKRDREQKETSSVEEMRHFLGLSEHVSKQWRCQRCEQIFLVKLAQARTHDRDCRVVLRTIGTVDEAAVAHVAKKYKVAAQLETRGAERSPRWQEQQEQLQSKEAEEEEGSKSDIQLAARDVPVDERLAAAKRYFLVRASAKDRSVSLRRSKDMDDCACDGSTGLLKDGTVVEAAHETKDWVQLNSGLWLPKKFLRSVETFENVLRYQR
jgi:hypothetical protein